MVYGPGMHGFVMREAEIGHRAAMYEDSEACGWSALWDVIFEEDMNNREIAQTVRIQRRHIRSVARANVLLKELKEHPEFDDNQITELAHVLVEGALSSV